MCGINGIALAARTGRAVEREALERMRDVLAHRGPDDYGLLLEGNIGLGHRRLSIVDVGGGHQPMQNEDGALHVIYNGEVYNHADYRRALEQAGHVYRTYCDTETILHLYEEHGAACVERLRGMFAFAIWDRRRRELFIARDRFGVKPLYYFHSADGSLYFASEIKALFAAGAVKPQLNHAALPDYLANHATSGDETLFLGVRRLPPGHTMLWRETGELKIEKYWDLSFAAGEDSDGAGAHAKGEDDLVAEWAELFRESVRLRLMADVPLGMFLSGGIDSSAIAAVMSEMVTEPIKTFSVAFAEREANELEYARVVARAFKTDHHEVVVSPEEFFRELPALVWHEDEPLAHPSSVALNFVSRLAARHVKVVLTGEGSDETLAGYERYRKTVLNLALGGRYYQLTGERLRALVRRASEAAPLPGALKAKLRRTFLYLPPEIESIYFDNFAVFGRERQRRLLTAQTLERAGVAPGGEPDPYVEVRRFMRETDAPTLLGRLLYADTKTYLHELLMKQDQMSMAASIESRVPFLDHHLVEFTARLPERLKLRGWTTKYVLRRAMRGVLPEQILTRPKMGFPVPVGEWFRGAYRSIVEEYVLSQRAAARDIFDRAEVERLVAEHMARAANHTERLWSLVNFEMWMRRFVDGEEASARGREREAEAATVARR
jgi:asparagine synthase (glutamine-hydrolysing)